VPERPPRAPGAPTSDSLRVHADYSRAVLDDLYRYRRKRRLLAWALWLTTGLLGGHRFYLSRTGTGVLMLFTGGGAGLWWLADAFLLSGMVRGFNQEQVFRERAGLPPAALDFMPPLETAQIEGRPEWALKRTGNLRLAGDAVVLMIAGVALGTITANTGNPEGILAVLALIAITILGARWDALAHLPLLKTLDRWSHRLRLFYHFNDPGGPLSLLVRPLVGLFTAAFRKKARAEARLYLQLGGVFAVVFVLLDMTSAVALSGGGVNLSIGGYVRDVMFTFVAVYAFATPIGATLTTHLLLERTDYVLWGLSGLTVFALGLGLFGA
jgi:TM2 domain-containing membrane protein YozV